MRCSKTGVELTDPSDGIYDDGEWISWDYINQHIYSQERQAEFPAADPELVAIFDDLLELAIRYKATTGRYLPLFGELGELYAEIKFGLKRHRPHAAGSDGKLGDDFVEVKTITPDKRVHKVHVKRAGNFSKLLIVKVSRNFEFEAKMIGRRALQKSSGRRLSALWSAVPASTDPNEVVPKKSSSTP